MDSDKSGTVTSKEFVSQVYKMKSSDTQFMLAYIKYYITEIKDRMREDMSILHRDIEKDILNLEEDIASVSSAGRHVEDAINSRKHDSKKEQQELAPVPEKAPPLPQPEQKNMDELTKALAQHKKTSGASQ